MGERYKLGQSGPSPSKEEKRRKVNAADVAALQKRAEGLAAAGGGGRAGVQARARLAYDLYLDCLRHGIALDFPRWLSQHSGIPRTTCRRHLKAGRALAGGAPVNRNQSGLLAEQREREQTPGPEVNWDEE